MNQIESIFEELGDSFHSCIREYMTEVVDEFTGESKLFFEMADGEIIEDTPEEKQRWMETSEYYKKYLETKGVLR